MRRLSLLVRVSGLAIAAISRSADAQVIVDTTSEGERYESIYNSDISTGSVSYEGEVNATINGDSVLLVDLPNRFGSAYSEAEVIAQLPSGYAHDVDGVGVTIAQWSAPALVDSQEELVGYFYNESSNSFTYGEASVTLTSGDFPGAEVLTGFRSNCLNGGTSGDTNFGSFDGVFAACEGGDIVTADPGTIIRNSHTTTVIVDETTVTEIYDYAYRDFYALTPLASSSWSSGMLENVDQLFQTMRNDTAATTFVGTVGDIVLFDESVAAGFSSTEAQALLADVSAPRAHHIDGSPVVVTWSEPILDQQQETLVSSETSTSTATTQETVQVVTTTIGIGSGELVLIGDRGSCSTTGTGGVVNGPGATGANALCDGGITYQLANGETNTNTHTTTVTTGTIVTTTTENWLIEETYALVGTAQSVGMGHAATVDGLIADSRSFARLHGSMLRDRAVAGLALWAAGFTGDASRDSRAGLAGWSSDRDGLAAGATFAFSGIATIGVGIARSDNDMRIDGGGGQADIRSTHVGAGAEFSPGFWHLQVGLGRSWNTIDTRRGSAALGGISTTDYKASTWFAAARGGPSFSFGLVSLRPYASADWVRTRIGGFTESGGFALMAPRSSQSRTEIALGTQIEAAIKVPWSWGVRVEADVAAGTSLGRNSRRRAVAFVADPTNGLEVRSARASSAFVDGDIGLALMSPGGLKIRLGGRARFTKGERDWQANAALAMRF